MGAIGNVGVVLHPRRDSAFAIESITGWAERRGLPVLGLKVEVGRIACSALAVDAERLAEESTLVVSLGGDGTMLRALRLLRGHTAPVLGVNLGRLGFLAEVDVADLPDALSAIDAHRFDVERRSAVAVTRAGRTSVAFNDVAMVRSPGHGMAAVALRSSSRRRPAPPRTASPPAVRSSRREPRACS
jgi:NAD+ kinase